MEASASAQTWLGVTTTHLLTVDMAQFATIIDFMGRLSITVDEPFRDANAGLDIPGPAPADSRASMRSPWSVPGTPRSTATAHESSRPRGRNGAAGTPAAS